MLVAAFGVGMAAPAGAAEAATFAETTETTQAGKAGDLTGTVKDKTGTPVAGATIKVLTPQRAVVATATSEQSGAFKVTGLADGQYLLVVSAPRMAEQQAGVTIADGRPVEVDVMLDLAAHGEAVTVTATPGLVSDVNRISQPITFISADDILARAKTVVAQAFEGETGVQLQRTSPGMAGVFVRGLTGNKVNVFIDGVRFANGAQRGGVNTFLDLIDPATLEGIEVLRGPSSAEYGSDALGGSIQFLTNVPALSSTGRPVFSGWITAGAESAHVGGVGGVALGYARDRFSLFGTTSYRQVGDYKPGGGEDSHAAVTRFLGVPSSELYPERMPETGFNQSGSQLRVNWVASPKLFVVGNYVRSRQDGANRWDQRLGGDGNLIAELNDLQLDLAYMRVESFTAGWFDRASATYSFNTQREERVNQGGQGNPNGAITHQPERTTVHGVQFNASRQLSEKHTLSIGGDTYFEKLTSDATDVNPTNGAVTTSRPRVPDQATYTQGGVFAQSRYEVSGRMTLMGAVRVGFNAYRAYMSDAPIVNGKPLWPDDSLNTVSGTYRAGVAFRASDNFTFTGAVSSGYRAPHMTDLGTLGLTGSGFEVAAPDVAGLGGFVGTTADASAVSTGRAVEQVKPETSLNFDGGVHFRSGRIRMEFDAFSNTIHGNIQKQALILPQGAVGISLGGEVITSQTPDGAVFVAASTVPVLVRANFDKARVWGIEWLGEFELREDTTLGTTYTYLRAKDLDTGLSPNIEGGTPAPGGTVWVRYARSGQKWWVQPYVTFAGEQTHLSSLDLGDRRTGATRTRSQIQNYFRRGATVNGWVGAGTDGVFGNGDDILLATGETLTQVQDRVLGVGVNSLPLFTSVPSYVLYGLRFGFGTGRHTIVVDAENLSNESYRGISWGMDGAGRGISVRYMVKW
jgi:hemoglobin/transferrin/lactoferrin receptor protein